jgi:hypothetical protein
MEQKKKKAKTLYLEVATIEKLEELRAKSKRSAGAEVDWIVSQYEAGPTRHVAPNLSPAIFQGRLSSDDDMSFSKKAQVGR